MGRSGSSSQANQATSTANADNRVVNESGIVAQGSALDMSTDWSNTNTTNTTDNSVMNLASYDSRDYSTHAAYSDNSSRSTSLTDIFTDNSNRSTSNSLTDIFTDNRSTNTWDSSSTSSVAGSYNTTADPLIAKAAFDFATNNDARNGEGFDKLLQAASELTNKTQDTANNLTSRFMDSIGQAFDTGRNTTPGGIDNKTMIVLGVAGAAALAFMAKKG